MAGLLANGTTGGKSKRLDGRPANGAVGHSPGHGMPVKQKMALGFKSLLEGAKKLAIGDNSLSPGPAAASDLFRTVDPAVDGEDCLHDCSSCTISYPKSFKIEEDDFLYGHVKGWSTHILVATGKTDWVRDVADEKGSVMQAVEKAEKPNNGRMMLSASNIPTPHHSSDYSEPTTVLLLPAFVVIDNVTPAAVPTLISEYVNKGPTNTSPLAPVSLPPSLPPLPEESRPEAMAKLADLTSKPCPHAAIILLCSQRTRDARCGQSAPLLRRELERHLRPLGLFRDLDDDRPGGVGIYFISHVGGHKYSANAMIYRRPNAFGLDDVPGAESGGAAQPKATKFAEGDEAPVGAAQCLWLARLWPDDCENLVKFTVLRGKVVKPDRQLRGGFDREKGLMSW